MGQIGHPSDQNKPHLSLYYSCVCRFPCFLVSSCLIPFLFMYTVLCFYCKTVGVISLLPLLSLRSFGDLIFAIAIISCQYIHPSLSQHEYFGTTFNSLHGILTISNNVFLVGLRQCLGPSPTSGVHTVSTSRVQRRDRFNEAA